MARCESRCGDDEVRPSRLASLAPQDEGGCAGNGRYLKRSGVSVWRSWCADRPHPEVRALDHAEMLARDLKGEPRRTHRNPPGTVYFVAPERRGSCDLAQGAKSKLSPAKITKRRKRVGRFMPHSAALSPPPQGGGNGDSANNTEPKFMTANRQQSPFSLNIF